jgi:PAS domain S-box-containing protein
MKMPPGVVADQPIFLSTIPAGPGGRRLAFAVIALSLLIFLSLAPFARVPLPPVFAFIPIYQSAIAFSDLITVAILLVQFNILRSSALLALACGYLFTALMAICHGLTFPGLFAARGLLGAGPQSTAWIYMFWHGGFPLAVIAYCLLRERGGGTQTYTGAAWPVVLAIVSGVVAAAAGLTALATIGQELLPDLLIGGFNNRIQATAVTVDLILTGIGLVMLRARRPPTVLDLWLMVVLCTWLFDVALSALLNASRFDLGYYAGRVYGLLAATFVLTVLLTETGALYAQLAKLFQAEQLERRREAEERRRIFETSLDVILVVDRQGDVLRVSPSSAATLGYEPTEMIGRNAIEFVHPDDLEAIRTEMHNSRRGSLVRDFAARYIHKNGSIVMLSWSGVWSEPEQRHFFIGRDVTRQKRVERMKDEFIATVSHELRTPVTTIAGPLNLLVSGAAGELPERAKRLVTMAHSNSTRLALLVSDILDIERIESGKMPFNFRCIDAKRLLEQVIEANRTLADKFGVRVYLHTDVVEASVYTDGDRLFQAATNLLSNAVKFSPKSEEVTVTIELRDDYVRIAVRDHGPGIPDEYKTLIFNKFAQVEATDSRLKGGTGLGLSIVRETMVRLGGSVGHLPAPSGGTIFYIDVPRRNFEATREPEARRSADAA